MNKLIKFIEENSKFVILRHVNPDGDAFGSQWGLANFIIENYPSKEVYVLGDRPDNAVFFPENIEPEGLDIRDAVTIVLDSATTARIDGPYQESSFVLNIDHHPSEAPYGDAYIVESFRSSTCELVANLLLPTHKVSKKTATYLLAGILTDTNKFSTENTNADTLRIAGELVGLGVDIAKVSQHFFSKSYKKLITSGALINEIEFFNGVAMLIISKERREALNLSVQEAKLYNSVMAGVQEFEIYAVLVEDDQGLYTASLRSKNVTINSICENYGGGGHRLACGIRDLTRDDINTLKEKLLKALEN